MNTVDQIIASAGHKVVNHDEPGGEPVVIAEPVVVIPEEIKPAPVVADRFKILGETFGREFTTDEEVTTFKSSLTDNETKLKDFETRYASLEKTNQELTQEINPRGYFVSDELFTLNGLLTKFPGKNPAALTEISTKDFSKAHLESPMDVLALELMLEHPGIYTSKADAEEDIRAKYDVLSQDEDNNWVIDAQAKRRMQVDAAAAVTKFDAIKAQIEIPQAIDLTAKRDAKVLSEKLRIETMTEATAPLFTKMIPEALKEIEFPITITDDSEIGRAHV